ncbi:MAG: hypothetical protein ACLRIL_06060 [Fusicatenibacter saccharivorans]
MKKFSEIEYVRPDMEAEQEKVRAYTKALKEAKSYEELRGLFMEEKRARMPGQRWRKWRR